MTKHDHYVPPDPEKMKRAIEFVVPLVLDYIRRRKALGPTVSKNPEQDTLYKMLSQAAHHIERTFGHAGVRFRGLARQDFQNEDRVGARLPDRRCLVVR